MFTVDTKQDTCPIRIVYLEPDRAIVDNQIHDNALHPDCWLSTMRPIAVIKATEFSDMALGIEQRSNHRSLLLWAEEIEHFDLIHIIGHNGYQALGYDATLGPVPENEDLAEILEALEEGIPVNPDDANDLENEIESEAWVDHGQDDFLGALGGLLDTIDPDYHHANPDDDAPVPTEIVTALNAEQFTATTPTTWAQLWRDLYELGCTLMGLDGHIVDSNSISFPVDEWVKSANGRRSRFPDLLQEIAVESRDGER